MPISNYQVPGVYVTQSGSALTDISTSALNIAIIVDEATPGTNTDTFNNVLSVSGANLGQLTTPMVNLTSTGTYSTFSGYTVTWNNSFGATVTGTYGVNFTVTNSGGPFSYLSTSGTVANVNAFTAITGNGTNWAVTTTATNTVVSGASVTLTAITGTTVTGFNGTYTVASATPSAFYINNTSLSGVGSSTQTTATATQNVVPSGTVSITYGHNWGAYGYYTSYNSVFGTLGPALSGSSNAIVSPGTIAAQLAFQNGANTVSILPVARVSSSGFSSSASLSDWSRVFTVGTGTSSDPTYLMNLVGADVIVPLYGFVNSSGTVITLASGTLASGISNYLNAQANVGNFQRAFIGVDGTSNQVNSSQLQSLATGLNSTRISLIYPASVNYNPGFNISTGLNNVNFNIPGYYLASAIAGIFVGQPSVATPITNKKVYGFNAIPNQISLIDAQSNYLPYGITTVRQKRDGSFYILHGLTTNISTWVTQEISMNAISDFLANSVRSDLENSALVGGPLTKNTLASVIGVVQGTLTNSVSNGLIQSYQNLSYAVNPNSPTTVNVTFQYAPTYPINYIQASLSLNTQTGQVVYGNAQSNLVTY